MKNTSTLESRIRKGVHALGIWRHNTDAAMGVASPEVVQCCLRVGEVESVDVMGNDGFALASAFGRAKNIQCWIERVKDYDLERQNIVLGATPLLVAVNMGANVTESVNTLCESGAHVDALTHAGFSVLMAACANEDSDPMVVKEILSRMDRSVNYRMRSQSTKWKVLRAVRNSRYVVV